MDSIPINPPAEQPISKTKVGRFMINRVGDDPTCLRISIGEPIIVPEPGDYPDYAITAHQDPDDKTRVNATFKAVQGAYLVFRGEPAEVLRVLEDAVVAMRAARL